IESRRVSISTYLSIFISSILSIVLTTLLMIMLFEGLKEKYILKYIWFVIYFMIFFIIAFMILIYTYTDEISHRLNVSHFLIKMYILLVIVLRDTHLHTLPDTRLHIRFDILRHPLRSFHSPHHILLPHYIRPHSVHLPHCCSHFLDFLLRFPYVFVLQERVL